MTNGLSHGDLMLSSRNLRVRGLVMAEFSIERPPWLCYFSQASGSLGSIIYFDRIYLLYKSEKLGSFNFFQIIVKTHKECPEGKPVSCPHLHVTPSATTNVCKEKQVSNAKQESVTFNLFLHFMLACLSILAFSGRNITSSLLGSWLVPTDRNKPSTWWLVILSQSAKV